jgi:hypothetical protein
MLGEEQKFAFLEASEDFEGGMGMVEEEEADDDLDEDEEEEADDEEETDEELN